MAHQCSKCGAIAVFKSGVSKQGKPYQGYFCSDETCRNVDWVQTKPSSATQGNGTAVLLRIEKLLQKLVNNTIKPTVDKPANEPSDWDNPEV